MKHNLQSLQRDIAAISQQNPIIHNVTNLVVMQTTANALLALGASPIMAHAPEEQQDLSHITHALVLNIGTLDTAWINAMQTAQQAALTQQTPIILDPVGAGASHLRTKTAKTLINNGVDIIRGNASEILALSDETIRTKGVDSQHQSQSSIHAAQQLAQQHHCIVAVSGATDIITDGQQTILAENGTPMLTRITGMGCTATAIIAAFAAINNDHFEATIHGISALNLCAETAAEKSPGPGSLAVYLLDALYHLADQPLSKPQLQTYQ